MLIHPSWHSGTQAGCTDPPLILRKTSLVGLAVRKTGGYRAGHKHWYRCPWCCVWGRHREAIPVWVREVVSQDGISEEVVPNRGLKHECWNWLAQWVRGSPGRGLACAQERPQSLWVTRVGTGVGADERCRQSCRNRQRPRLSLSAWHSNWFPSHTSPGADQAQRAGALQLPAVWSPGVEPCKRVDAVLQARSGACRTCWASRHRDGAGEGGPRWGTVERQQSRPSRRQSWRPERGFGAEVKGLEGDWGVGGHCSQDQNP